MPPKSRNSPFLVYSTDKSITSWKNNIIYNPQLTHSIHLYFTKWNFLTLRLKNFLYCLKRKLSLDFRKWNPALFRPSSKKNYPEKISYISGNGNPEKISCIFSKESCSYIFYIPGKEILLYFRKRKL